MSIDNTESNIMFHNFPLFATIHTMTVDRKPEDSEAVRLFEAAAEKEANGNISDALGLYRQAFKLNPKVDLMYRADIIPTKLTNHKRLDEEIVKKIDVEKLIESFRDLEMTQGVQHLSKQDSQGNGDLEESESHKQPESKFMNLPHEVMFRLIDILLLVDGEGWLALSMTCKENAYMGFGRKEVWRKLCFLVYSKQIYQENVSEVDPAVLPEVVVLEDNEDEPEGEDVVKPSEDFAVPLDQYKMLPQYSSWRNMLSTRPFVKFNGCYISTVTYHSEGGKSEFSSSWSNPIRSITYYRYLRFYPDGTVVKVQSALEPQSVVSHLSKFNSAKSIPQVGGGGSTSEGHRIYHGTWTVSADGEIHVIINNGSVPYYVFHYFFRIKSLGKNRHGKLAWVRYFAIRKSMSEDDDREGEESLFTLKNEKPFKFSRVRSYTVNN